VPNKSLETPHYKLERLKHDDPRLDNIEASYTMAEEVEDPTTVTRRSQEPTNRQTPVIKGVLPDAPAPASLPKAETAKPTKPQAGKAEAKAESSGGFFGWLKRLFGGDTEAKTEPAKNVGKRGDRAGKEGERTERGERNGERRGGRGGRGGRRGDRNDRGERSDAERNDKGERNNERAEGQETRAPRENGGNRRGGERNERGGQRGERRESANNLAGQSADSSNVSADASELNHSEQRNETRGERAPRGEGRRERGEGRRERGERGERGERRNQDGNRPNASADNADPLASAQGLTNDSTSDAPSQDERADGNQGTPERRERRSRDRYGRDRRERNTGADSSATGEANAAPAENLSADQAHEAEVPATRSYFDRATAPAETTANVAPAAPAAPAAPVSAAPVATVAPTSAPTASAAPAGLPKVQTYVLPMASLIEVAEGSGLKWVNSDPEKIAQAQAAIAAEPKPVHVPRERPPAVVIDEGPLVLVETRKDLSNLNLPF
jgi:ribonuclease E